jgi:hypothetical protein
VSNEDSIALYSHLFVDQLAKRFRESELEGFPLSLKARLLDEEIHAFEPRLPEILI